MPTTWNSNGIDAAQLFRDFYFGKYTKSTTPHTIYEDRDRPYRFYNENAFYRHVKKVREQVETYKVFKTGLNNPTFKTLLRLHEIPTDEELKSGLVEEKEGSKKKTSVKSSAKKSVKPAEKDDDDDDEDEDDDDSTYNEDDNKEEDLPSIGTGFDLESYLDQLTIETHSKKAPHLRSAMTFVNNVVGEKFLAICPDGRLAGLVKLPSGFNGSIFISEDCRKVMMKTMIPKVMVDAQKSFAKLGIPKTNVFVVHLQAVMDTVKNNAEKGPGTSLYTESVVFQLPMKVRPTFTNHEGYEDHSVQIGTSSGVEWAFFFMEDVNMSKICSPEARMEK